MSVIACSFTPCFFIALCRPRACRSRPRRVSTSHPSALIASTADEYRAARRYDVVDDEDLPSRPHDPSTSFPLPWSFSSFLT